MLAEHLARYRYVAPLLAGRILDLGCGTGYGAREIARAEVVREVVAIDRSTEALEWAGRYYPDPKVHRMQVDISAVGWDLVLGTFDGIVAFEVIEHLQEEIFFWSGIRRALRRDGVLWLSTPLGRGRGIRPSDPFHVHQLRRSEVVDLFRAGWTGQAYGQSGTSIESWIPGRRYRTILVRARISSDAGRAGGGIR